MNLDDRLIACMYKLDDEKISTFTRKVPADDSLVIEIGQSLLKKRSNPWYLGVHEGIVMGFNSGVKRSLETYLTNQLNSPVKIQGDRTIQSIRFIEYYFYNIKLG